MWRPTKKGNIIGETEDKVLIEHPVQRDVHKLQPFLYYVWMHCDGSRTIDQLINLIIQEAKSKLNIELSSEHVNKVLHSALEQLRKAGLIE